MNLDLNYKQMVLLEDLIDFLSAGSYRISFMMHDVLCVGQFRKNKGDDSGKQGKHAVHTEKLWQDYAQFFQEDRAYFHGLMADIAKEPEFARDKKLTTLFNHAVSFLIVYENEVDQYLTGYDGPGMIYDLHNVYGHVESYLIAGAGMNPFSMFPYVDRLEEENKTPRLTLDKLLDEL